MKVKTSELTGPALDWAVAKAAGLLDRQGGAPAEVKKDRHTGRFMHYPPYLSFGDEPDDWAPSTDWSQGGPIIEREKISVEFCAGFWRATRDDRPATCEHAEEDGPTPLIAAMRCFAASRLGDEVDVPEELLS